MEFVSWNPGKYILSQSHVGYKYLVDEKKGCLIACVRIPAGATVVCPSDYKYDMRTNRYVIEKIYDIYGHPVKSGVGPVCHMLYEVNLGYVEPNLNTTIEESYVRGLHFYPQVKYAVDMIFASVCRSGNSSVVMRWISHGTKSADDGLLITCRSGDIKNVEMMIGHGAKNFEAGLIEACGAGNGDAASMMISHGAKNFDAGLIAAAKIGDVNIANMMIEHGAKNFDAALVEAHYHNHTKLIARLLECGANPSIQKQYVIQSFLIQSIKSNKKMIQLSNNYSPIKRVAD
jgi:hypothetical protein